VNGGLRQSLSSGAQSRDPLANPSYVLVPLNYPGHTHRLIRPTYWRAAGGPRTTMMSNIASAWRYDTAAFRWLALASRVGHEFVTSPRCKVYRGEAQLFVPRGVIVEVF